MSGRDGTRLPAKRRIRADGGPGYDKYLVQERFLLGLRHSGNVEMAVEAAQNQVNIDGRIVMRPVKQTFYNWRAQDAEFREAWDDALSAATGELVLNMRKLALFSPSEGTRFDATRLLLTKQRRDEFGDGPQAGSTTIIVKSAIPAPLNPDAVPEATAEDLAMLGTAGLIVEAEAVVVDDDGVPND